MRDSSDYYNFLSDTFRNGYHQIKSVYEKFPDARSQNKFVNIRTGYLMKRHKNSKNYYYSRDVYPICWNFLKRGYVSFNVINRIFFTYSKLLDCYVKDFDELKVKEMMDDEILKAKNIMMENKELGKLADDYVMFDPEGNGESDDRDSESYTNESLEDEGNDSFIVPDDSEEDIDKINSESKEVSDDETITYSEKNDNTLHNDPKKVKKLKGKKLLKKKRLHDNLEDFEEEAPSAEKSVKPVKKFKVSKEIKVLPGGQTTLDHLLRIQRRKENTPEQLSPPGAKENEQSAKKEKTDELEKSVLYEKNNSIAPSAHKKKSIIDD